MTKQDAYLLRENTGTSGVVDTARAAVAALADYDIPHLIVGGVAVQEHGKDKTDVFELVLRCKLPRGLAVAPATRELYLETWDAIQTES